MTRRAEAASHASLDMFDAFHPQTILVYGMNGHDVAVKHGAPVRLHTELHSGLRIHRHAAPAFPVAVNRAADRYEL